MRKEIAHAIAVKMVAPTALTAVIRTAASKKLNVVRIVFPSLRGPYK